MKMLSMKYETWNMIWKWCETTFILPKTPSFIPGQRCPQNLENSIIIDVQFSNFNNSEVVKDINELLSYSDNLVF